MDNESDINSIIGTNTMPVSLTTQIIFYIFVLLDVPSIICCFLLFYSFLCLPELRQRNDSNLMIIYLLISAFLLNAIDIPLQLPYFQNYHYIVSLKYPKAFCIFWLMYDYSTFALNLWFMALLSLERYLLIFFKSIVTKTKKRRLFLYYGPATVIFLFLIVWYLYLIAFYPCEQTQFDYTQVLCGFPCYETSATPALRNFDWIAAGLLPVFLAVFFTLILILHVLYQKHKISRHLTQQQTWKRTRKMFLQLLPITSMFLLFIMPLIIVGLLSISNPWYGTTPYFYVVMLSYCWPLCVPFGVLSKQPVIRKRLFTLFRPRRFNRPAPIVAAASPI